MDTSDARLRGLCVFGEADIGNTNIKTEKTQDNNTKFIALDSWLGVLLAAPGVCIGGGPAAAGERPPCLWIITRYLWYQYLLIELVHWTISE